MGLSRQAALAGIAAIGLLLAGVVCFDIYADWLLEGEPLWTTAVENALPLGLALGLPYASYRLARSDSGTAYVTSVARWTGAGFLAMGVVSTVVVGFQLLQGGLKPWILVTQTTIVGAVGGLLVGYRTANLRRTQDRLTDEKERWQSLFENDFTSIVDISAAGDELVVAAANDRFASLAGVSADSAVGKPLFEVTEPYADDAETTLRTHVRDGEFYRTEVSYQTTEGEKHFTLRLVPYGDDRAFLIYRDVTEVTETRQELEAAVEKLQQSNEHLEKFASVVSHDLRNPLNVAQSTTELLAAEADADASVAEHHERLTWAHDRMETLISDMLTLARQGRAVDETEQVSLAEFVRNCWRAVETDEATLDVAATGEIEADPNRLRQLFENLFRNSVDHGGDGVTVRVVDTPNGFAVTDDGPGIPDGEAEQVFETGYTTGDGTGFGLSIVADIAEAHGWDVSVCESESGGARFDITGVEWV